jgi:hypothetical protein
MPMPGKEDKCSEAARGALSVVVLTARADLRATGDGGPSGIGPPIPLWSLRAPTPRG